MTDLSTLDLVFYSVLGLLAVSTIYSVGTNPRVVTIYRHALSLRPRHVIANLPVMVITIAAAFALTRIPGLNWGWAQLFGGEGNVMLGMKQDAGEPGSLAQLFPFFMIGTLLAAMPALVLEEEEAFRLHSENRTRGQLATRALLFGVIHIAVGIPLGAGIALGIAGWWFTNRYLTTYNSQPAFDIDRVDIREYLDTYDWLSRRTYKYNQDAALKEAFLAHLAWNYTLVALILVSLMTSL